MTERDDIHVTSIAIAVVEHNDRLLIGVRPPGTVLAGYWEFPGGKLNPGESPLEGAARECQEETGLRIETLGVLLVQEHEYSHGRLQLHFIHCQPTHPKLPPLPPFTWIARSDLSQYAFPAGNRELLQHLAQGPLSRTDA